MNRDFSGVGWKFPVQVDSKGKIAFGYEVDIKESIWIILSTAKGERAMMPDFGCAIHDMIFEVANTTTMGLAEESVREALIMWEPRIELINVEATLDGVERNRLLINIDYRVSSTNNEFNLVYPFYLSEGR